MRRVELLLEQSRRSTENVEFSDDSGIPDNEFIQYLNDGQDEIQGIIQNQFPDVFQRETTIDIVAGQEAYDIPSDAFLRNRVDTIEYSVTGNTADYYQLYKGWNMERLNGTSSNPEFFIRRSNQILLQPKPQGAGNIRIVYQKALPKLDKRRAQVSSVTTSGQTILTLTLDSTQFIDDTALLEENYLTIVDKYGATKAKGIPVSAINTTTGVVTIDGTHVMSTGESIAVGDYALRGKDSVSNSELPDICEKYLLEYMNLRILMRDSSVDSSELGALFQKLESTIKTAFAEPDGGPNTIPVTDIGYLGGWG